MLRTRIEVNVRYIDYFFRYIANKRIGIADVDIFGAYSADAR